MAPPWCIHVCRLNRPPSAVAAVALRHSTAATEPIRAGVGAALPATATVLIESVKVEPAEPGNPGQCQEGPDGDQHPNRREAETVGKLLVSDRPVEERCVPSRANPSDYWGE